MKTILNTLMLTTMAVAGFAADNKLNFHVEFPFTVGKVLMPAGQYSVALASERAAVVQVKNVGNGKSVFVNFPTRTEIVKTDGKTEIVFSCGDSGCSITKVSNLLEGHSFSAWATRESPAKLIAVSLTPTLSKAE